MQFSISPGVPIILPVHVFGATGARRMLGMLDTGASLMTVPPEDAAVLGYDLDGAPTTRVLTAGGTVEARQIVLSRVRVAGYDLTEVPALCLPISVARASALLGLSLLAHLNFSVDNKAGTLTITDP